MPDSHPTRPATAALVRTVPIPAFTAERAARFWANVSKEPDGGCWNWHGKRRSGYGVFSNLGVHRIAYTMLVGEIPNGLTLDHLCRNRLCLNPSHLEPISASDNVMRGLSARHGMPILGAPLEKRRRTSARFHRRRARGLCVQCNTPSEKYRCDRCRAVHNERSRERRAKG